jgi:hypothetical protein
VLEGEGIDVRIVSVAVVELYAKVVAGGHRWESMTRSGAAAAKWALGGETWGMGLRELDAVRRIAFALPEVTERWSHGAPCLFVRRTRALCYFHDDHRGNGRVSLWCPAGPGVQEELVSTKPGRFFSPPTSAEGTFSNWLGVFLHLDGDDQVDCDDVAAILEDAYRVVAPNELIAQLASRERPDHRDATAAGRPSIASGYPDADHPRTPGLRHCRSRAERRRPSIGARAARCEPFP